MFLEGLVKVRILAQRALKNEDFALAANILNDFLLQYDTTVGHDVLKDSYKSKPDVPYFVTILPCEMESLLSKSVEDLEAYLIKYKIRYSEKVLAGELQRNLNFIRRKNNEISFCKKSLDSLDIDDEIKKVMKGTLFVKILQCSK